MVETTQAMVIHSIQTMVGTTQAMVINSIQTMVETTQTMVINSIQTMVETTQAMVIHNIQTMVETTQAMVIHSIQTMVETTQAMVINSIQSMVETTQAMNIVHTSNGADNFIQHQNPNPLEQLKKVSNQVCHKKPAFYYKGKIKLQCCYGLQNNHEIICQLGYIYSNITRHFT
ncbi:hypothetical protein CHS0354_008896, partial [Potamilus streckersoni]